MGARSPIFPYSRLVLTGFARAKKRGAVFSKNATYSASGMHRLADHGAGHSRLPKKKAPKLIWLRALLLPFENREAYVHGAERLGDRKFHASVCCTS